MFGLGTGEIVLIFLIVVIVFGATKLPQLGDGLGRAIKNFKRSVGGQNEIEVGKTKTAIESDTAEASKDAAASDGK